MRTKLQVESQVDTSRPVGPRRSVAGPCGLSAGLHDLGLLDENHVFWTQKTAKKTRKMPGSVGLVAVNGDLQGDWET